MAISARSRACLVCLRSFQVLVALVSTVTTTVGMVYLGVALQGLDTSGAMHVVATVWATLAVSLVYSICMLAGAATFLTYTVNPQARARGYIFTARGCGSNSPSNVTNWRADYRFDVSYAVLSGLIMVLNIFCLSGKSIAASQLVSFVLTVLVFVSFVASACITHKARSLTQLGSTSAGVVVGLATHHANVADVEAGAASLAGQQRDQDDKPKETAMCPPVKPSQAGKS